MRHLIRLFAGAVQRAPLALVLGTIVVTAVLGPLSQQVELAQGNEGFAPDNAEIQAEERIAELFGASSQERVLQVIVRASDGSGDVISAAGLAAVNRVAEAIHQSEASELLSQTEDRPAIVSFLAPVQQAATRGAPVDTDAAIDQVYLQALDPANEAAQAGQAAFITSLLASAGTPATATSPGGLILVFLRSEDTGDAGTSFDAQVEVDRAIADAVEAVATPDGIEARPFSFPLLFASQDDFQAEVGQLFGYAALIILVILGFVYWLTPRGGSGMLRSVRRTAADVGLTLVTIFAAISWMQGIGVLLERAGILGSFNPVTQIIPILLIGLGVDYGIHITTRYREEVGEGAGVDPAIRTAIGTVGVALTLATITTALGFLTNVFNPVPALQDFGMLSAIGITVSFVLMLTFVPAVRELMDRRAERAGRLPREALGATSERILPRVIERASILAERLPVITIAIALALGGAGVWGLTQLETRFSITDFLPEDAPEVETLEILTEEFGGGLGERTRVLVQATAGVDLSSSEAHNALVVATGRLTDVPDVVTFDTPDGEVASVSSPIGLLQTAFAGGSQAAPEPVLVAAGQVGLQPDLTVTADAEPLWSALERVFGDQAAAVIHWSDDGRVDAVLVDIQTQAGEAGAQELRRNLVDAFTPVADLEGVSAIPTSNSIISAVVVDELSRSQTASLLITLVVATLVLAISFWFENRRPFLGVLTMLPVALVVFWTYGLMYATGIPFGPVTATLAALAVGIGVPFTIHITRRFEEDRVRFSSLEDALRSTTRHTGGALAGSAFTTMAGFGILVTSSLVPFQQMGLVTAYAIGLSLAGAVLVLPSLLALWERWHRKGGSTPVEKETAPVI